ncbi:MAG: hypothetical protein Q8K24_05905 [Hydrogenophaga sp.]|nr:hypothetical protein [Hydrogenophaga sp.]
MHSAFSRLNRRVLAVFGEDALLRGEVVDPPRRIAVKHGLQLTGYGSEEAMYRGDLVVEKDVAYVPSEYNPAAGDRLQHPDGDYDLDVRIKDNGHMQTWVLREHYNGD